VLPAKPSGREEQAPNFEARDEAIDDHEMAVDQLPVD